MAACKALFMSGCALSSSYSLCRLHTRQVVCWLVTTVDTPFIGLLMASPLPCSSDVNVVGVARQYVGARGTAKHSLDPSLQ